MFQQLSLSDHGTVPVTIKNMCAAEQELELDEEGLPRMVYEPRPLPPPEPSPPSTAGRGIFTPEVAAPAPAVPRDPNYAFLSGERIDEFVEQLAAGASSPRPSMKQQQQFAYFREQGLHDVAPPGARLTTLPNPFQLISFERISRRGQTMVTSPLTRYLTVSLAGGVTLWVDGSAVEAYPLDEWRAAHASFARITTAPPAPRTPRGGAVFTGARKRHIFRQWLKGVQRNRGQRRRAALLRARREAQDELEAVSAPAIVAETFGPAVEVVRRVSGWIRAQKFEAQQVGAAQPPKAPKPGTSSSSSSAAAVAGSSADSISLGASNGPALAKAINDQLRRAVFALSSAYKGLRAGLDEESTKPLATTNADGCKFLLEKYSRRIYPVVAPLAFNRPANVRLLTYPHGNVATLQPPPFRALRGASLETLDRWLDESTPCPMVHSDQAVERVHQEPAARMLRLADMLVCSSVLQLPLDALREFTKKFKGSAWKRLTGADNTPVLTLLIERNANYGGIGSATGSKPLIIAAPSPTKLARQLLRHCVASLSELKLPSESGEFSALLKTHLHAQGELAREGAAAVRAPTEEDEEEEAHKEEEAAGSSAFLTREADAARGTRSDAARGSSIAGDVAARMESELEAMAERAWAQHVEAQKAEPGAAVQVAPRSSKRSTAAPQRNRLVTPAAAPTSLRRFLERHYFESPLPAVVKALDDLESAMAASIRKAEAVATAHPPFVAALTEEGKRGLAQAPSLRTLDVGCIRIDGAELWPDEARECFLEPHFAPMTLHSILTDYAKEPPPKPPKSKSSMFNKGGGVDLKFALASVKAILGDRDVSDAAGDA